MLKQYIDAGKSFSIETTLAGKNAIRQMKTAKAKAYEITMFYVGLRNVDQNIKRVEMRVENGGHHIETEDILRRNITSFNHLYENTHLVDNLILIDNSESDGEVILEITNGAISFREENLPSWALSVVKQF